jgi:hypothetical protein
MLDCLVSHDPLRLFQVFLVYAQNISDGLTLATVSNSL